jgi:hypothetical protein
LWRCRRNASVRLALFLRGQAATNGAGLKPIRMPAYFKVRPQPPQQQGVCPIAKGLDARRALTRGRRHHMQRQGRAAPARQHPDERTPREIVAGDERGNLNDAEAVKTCAEHRAAIRRDKARRHGQLERPAVTRQANVAQLALGRRQVADPGVAREVFGPLGQTMFFDVARRGAQVTAMRITASVGSTIVGVSRSSKRMSRGP